jgi:thiol-disulfide isomerase/thioredoxin
VRLAGFVIALSVTACTAAYEPPPARQTPARASAFDLLDAAPDLDGRPIGAPEGRKTVAIVFASWCANCRHELGELAGLKDRADVRIIGVNFKWQEEYDARGDSASVRAMLATEAPWLRVAPGDEALYAAMLHPPKVPTVYVFDASGNLVKLYRHLSEMPDAATLGALLDAL